MHRENLTLSLYLSACLTFCPNLDCLHIGQSVSKLFPIINGSQQSLFIGFCQSRGSACHCTFAWPHLENNCTGCSNQKQGWMWWQLPRERLYCEQIQITLNQWRMHGEEAAGHQITGGCYSESLKQRMTTVTVLGDDRGALKFQWKFKNCCPSPQGPPFQKKCKKHCGKNDRTLNHLTALKQLWYQSHHPLNTIQTL